MPYRNSNNINAKVHFEQGGDALNVSSGGAIRWSSVELTSASTTSIPATGFATIVASTAGPNYDVDAPIAGAPVWITVSSNTSSGTATIETTGEFATGKNRLKFDAVGEHVILVGTSTGGWHVHNFDAAATTSG